MENDSKEKNNIVKKINDLVTGNVLNNLVYASMITIYFMFFNMYAVFTETEIFIQYIKIASFIFLLFSIFIFEIAYKKDSGTLAIYGIETLIVGIITLFLPYIIFELQPQYQIFYNLVGAYFGVYYIIKCICIAVKSKNNYSKSISDVKEIVKKEKRQIKDEDDKIKEPEQEKITEDKEEPEKLVEEKKAEKKKADKAKVAKADKAKAKKAKA